MKHLAEILKELGAIFFAGLFAVLGTMLAHLVLGIPFFDKEGHIAWALIIVAIVCVVVGQYLYKIGEKILEK